MVDQSMFGQKVRGGKLVPHTKYVMRTFSKPHHTFSLVQFLGAGTSLSTAKAPIGMLKAQAPGTIFFFRDDKEALFEVLPGAPGEGWLGLPAADNPNIPVTRVTFASPVPGAVVEPAAETAAAETARIVADIASEHGVTLTEPVPDASYNDLLGSNILPEAEEQPVPELLDEPESNEQPPNPFKDLPVIGAMQPEEASEKLREIGEDIVADAIDQNISEQQSVAEQPVTDLPVKTESAKARKKREAAERRAAESANVTA